MSAARRIRAVVFDVDGVLTDGTFVLRGDDDETKAFHVRDGFGIRLLKEAGLKVAFLTGRRSSAVERRGLELGVDLVVQGSGEKGRGLEEVCARLGADLADTAYMGDDVADVPALRRAGFAASPADGHPAARSASAWVAGSPGGRGAARDLCEHLLAEQGTLEALLQRHLG